MPFMGMSRKLWLLLFYNCLIIHCKDVTTAKKRKKHNNNVELQQIYTKIGADHTQWLKLPIKYIPIPELSADIWSQTQWSISERYDEAHTYPNKHFFDHLIGESADIELYINENDSYATQRWVEGYRSEMEHTMHIPGEWYRLQVHLDGKQNLSSDDFDTAPVEINGFDPDVEYANLRGREGRSTTGMNGEFFKRRPTCVQLKACNVYPHWRVLHRSRTIAGQSFSCEDIMTSLMPPIYECVEEHGWDCPLIIGHGYYRVAFKLQLDDAAAITDPIIVRIMRPDQFDDYARDLQRHVRELMLLHYLQLEEQAYIDAHGADFISNGQERAFPFVRDLGHCVYPSYIAVSFYYPNDLMRWVQRGMQATKTLRELMQIALDIAKGTEIIHNVRGGPFTHADLDINQYMIDENGRVLINDFNRGKMAKYRFPEDLKGRLETDLSDKVVRCRYCGYESNGNNRAPEELQREQLDEGKDVFATAGVIYSVFKGTLTWHGPYEIDEDGEAVASDSEDAVDYGHIPFLVHDTHRRPGVTHTMPYALQEALRSAWTQNVKERPTARAFRQRIQHIYDNLDHYTEQQSDVTWQEADSKRLFRERRYPDLPSAFV